MGFATPKINWAFIFLSTMRARKFEEKFWEKWNGCLESKKMWKLQKTGEGGTGSTKVRGFPL